MFVRMAVSFSLLLVLFVGSVPAQGKKQQPADVQKAQQLVNDELKKLNASRVRVTHVADETLKSTFPDYMFFAVLFPQYPVGMAPPQPLSVANVFYVKKEEVKFVTNFKALEQFFKAHLGKTESPKAADTAITAWLRLSQELHQDGFYQFTISDVRSKDKEKGAKKLPIEASGKAVVVPKGGNKGEIVATLHFDADGKVARISESAKLIAGIRPICQATRLLDPDPLVRRIAELDLLVMGPLARDYLDEQRASAGPELRAAIDRIWQRMVSETREER